MEEDWLLLVCLTMVFKWIVFQPATLFLATCLHLWAADKLARRIAARSRPTNGSTRDVEMADLLRVEGAMMSNPMRPAFKAVRVKRASTLAHFAKAVKLGIRSPSNPSANSATLVQSSEDERATSHAFTSDGDGGRLREEGHDSNERSTCSSSADDVEVLNVTDANVVVGGAVSRLQLFESAAFDSFEGSEGSARGISCGSTERSNDGAGMEEDSGDGEWELHHDDETESAYWHNSGTGESRWVESG